MGRIEVKQPGLFSTIQDLGRFGLLKYGVPISGAMDSYGAKIGNLLLNNPENSAVLEITLMGPTLQFSDPTEIAISGALLSPTLNGHPVENNRALVVQGSDILSFGKRISGFRAYLAIKHGFQTEKVLNSRSWFSGITRHDRLKKGMILPYESYQVTPLRGRAGVRTDPYLAAPRIEAFPGPEFYRLSESEKIRLENIAFTVGTQSNRMGIQMNEKFENDLPAILTGPVLPGTVQLSPSGQLIVLMKDAQTTGGYPRIIQLSNDGINCLSQKMTGSQVQFQLNLPDGAKR